MKLYQEAYKSHPKSRHIIAMLTQPFKPKKIDIDGKNQWISQTAYKHTKEIVECYPKETQSKDWEN